MLSESPWSRLETGAIESRRVDHGARWNWFWAVIPGGDVALVMKLDVLPDPLPELPKLRNLEMRFEKLATGPILCIRLKDDRQIELFETLCRDVVTAGEVAEAELMAVERAIRRTFRWHNLLRGETSRILSDEEQKGLIGEIEVLKLLIAEMGAKPALSCWTGPSGAPKDFELPCDCIEVKARRTAAQPFVKISNEFQLADVPGRRLWLVVIAVDKVPDPLGETLTDVVSTIAALIESDDPSAMMELEVRLAEAGYDSDHDYSRYRWTVSEPEFHAVSEEFPRIAAPIALGVSNVNYSIALSACAPFRADIRSAKSAIFGRGNNE
ncbi:PD-(D/E)XK motif protein [Neorhizobium sp. S3-V5DH]|uniref:PD-(D/E)XK motif protein n=1 Tax=Neorhizobium sp. S3-V5DH TaxID=2485166 RepID=UPI0010E30F50|nr:PD-(D/E)XK motif protein [Neorhizobium sp. S3-V5DH]TCV76000.1 putative PD-(D/E)XK family protein DUF4420 [Neorhizobium sp. S3-V5DH]